MHFRSKKLLKAAKDRFCSACGTLLGPKAMYKGTKHCRPCSFKVPRTSKPYRSFDSLGVIVDPEDASIAMTHRAYIAAHGYVRIHHGRTDNYLHRILVGAKDGEHVDHINGNKLDCRKSNLRRCTVSDNQCNSKLRNDNSTGVRGVYIDKRRGTYVAQIRRHGKCVSLGSFRSIASAREARAQAEKDLHGEYAYAARPQ